MNIEELNYNLPSELIAQQPAENRDASRLLILNRCDGTLSDKLFGQIVEQINKGDCLVINNTKVLPAKFFAQRKTGGKIEGLFLNSAEENNWLVLLKNTSRLKEGEILSLLDRDKNHYLDAEAVKRLNNGQWLIGPLSALGPEKILGDIGFTPLPPYIKRAEPIQRHHADSQRYQTVYASSSGAVAAPTAGLHFTDKILEKIKNKGVEIAELTLHVGEGTFLPVKTETLEEHKIHSEWFSLDEENAAIINRTIQNGGRIIAVGTTSVRTLESVADGRNVRAASGHTDIFITPGFEFKIVDCIITNFHLPKSTLLALVGAFAGLETIKKAYRHAIEQQYRFYSYGDCMIIV